MRGSQRRSGSRGTDSSRRRKRRWSTRKKEVEPYPPVDVIRVLCWIARGREQQEKTET